MSSDNASFTIIATITEEDSKAENIEYIYTDPQIFHTKILFATYTAYIYLVLGTIFNVILILVFSRKTFNNTLTSKLFRFLACMDLLYILITTSPVVAEDIYGKPIVNLHLCKAKFYIRNIAKNMSSCALTLVTVERFIAVVFPHTARIICKPNRMYAVLFIAFWINLAIAVSGGWHMNALIFAVKQKVYEYSVCINESFTIAKLEHYQDKIWPWLDYLMYLIIPVILMVPMDIGIIIAVIKANRRRHSLAGNTPGGNSSATTNIASMTGMLLSACFTFFVFATPDAVAYFKPGVFPDDGDSMIWQAVAYWCLLNNHAFNLILYCLTGTKFRQETWAMLTSPWKKIRNTENVTVMTTVSKIDSECN